MVTKLCESCKTLWCRLQDFFFTEPGGSLSGDHVLLKLSGVRVPVTGFVTTPPAPASASTAEL